MQKEPTNARLEVLKTYKIYIGGQFPRTESGRYYLVTNNSGRKLANCCLSSRKDFRDAVVAARSAFGGWSARSAFNRGQILYRIAEMLEGRKAQFIEELVLQDVSRADAEQEVNLSIDRLIYYSGWCDKYQQVFSSVNPVASSHFNFSVAEPTGVVAVIAPQKSALIGLLSVIAPIIAGGNTCVVLASATMPLCAVTFAVLGWVAVGCGGGTASRVGTDATEARLGGYTGPGGVNDPAGIVHKGEVVWSQSDISKAGGVAAVEAMRAGGGVRAPVMPRISGGSKAGDVKVDARTTIDATGADAAAIARLHAAMQKRDAELPARVTQAIRLANKSNVKFG